MTSLVIISLLSLGDHNRYAPGCSRERPRLIVRMPLSPNVILMPALVLALGVEAMARQPNGIIFIIFGGLPVSN